MIGRTISHYRVTRKIGSGGMGVVYAAEDIRLGRGVALKFLHPELVRDEDLRRRFLNEARAASSLDHPNICHIYEVDETADGQLFIAMALYEGASARALAAGNPLEPEHCFQIAFSAAQGLGAAHARAIVHRDVKPDNIVITREGLVKIVDFGVARLLDQSRVTSGNRTAGTAAYMSPEQSHSGNVDLRTDIWSLGVTLFELLTGKLPFRGKIAQAQIYSILNEEPLTLAEANARVPAECQAVIDRCLQKNPDDRFPTMDAMMEAMVETAQSLGWTRMVSPSAVAALTHARRQRLTRRILRVGIPVAVGVALATTAVWKWTHREPSPYTTKMRVAVMPLENHLGIEAAVTVAGIEEYVSSVAERTAAAAKSAWVLPHHLILETARPPAGAVAETFGINTTITGDVQRFEDRWKLSLRARDATTDKERAAAEIVFTMTAMDSLLAAVPAAVAVLMGAAQPVAAGAIHDSRAATHYIDGLGHLQKRQDPQRLDAARAEFETVVAVGPDCALAQLGIADADWLRYRAAGGDSLLEVARVHAVRAVQLDSSLAAAHVRIGDIDHATGNDSTALTALTHYRTALALDGTSVDAIFGLTDVLAAANRITESENAFSRYFERYHDMWVVQRRLGVFYYRNERYDEAESAWRTALTQAPLDGLTLNNLGVIHWRQGQWEQARQMFLRAFRANPECQSCSNVATMLWFAHRFVESEQYFKLSMAYCDTTLHYRWGNWASAMWFVDGKRDSSITLFERAIHLAEQERIQNPRDAELIAWLIDYYPMCGRFNDTRRMLAAAEPFIEGNSRLLYSAATALAIMGDDEAATRRLADAVRSGYPLAEIVASPFLTAIVTDERFRQLAGIDDKQQATGSSTP